MLSRCVDLSITLARMLLRYNESEIQQTLLFLSFIFVTNDDNKKGFRLEAF